MKKEITILRVDPAREAVASMKMACGKNATPEVRRLVRAKTVGWREILSINGIVLVVAAGLEVDEAMRGWRLLGGEDTAGIGILFGKGPGGGMIDVPVGREWLVSRVRWLDGEDVETTRERAEATVPMLDEAMTAALRAAIPALDGEMWIPLAHQTVFDAALALGVGTPGSNGQRLSPMGVMVHEILIGEAR